MSMTFEEAWGFAEIKGDHEGVALEYVRKAEKEGEEDEHCIFRFINCNGRTFVPLSQLARAFGIKSNAVHVARRCGVGLRRMSGERGKYVLDALDAVRVVRYCELREPDFVPFFKDKIFPALSQGYGDIEPEAAT